MFILEKIDKKVFLLIIAVILLAGGLIWIAFFWQIARIRELSDGIQKEQLDFLVKQQRSQKILELGRELEDVDKYKKQLDAMFVNEQDAVLFLKELESIAVSTGNIIEISVYDLSKMKAQSAKKTTSQNLKEEATEDIKKRNQVSKTVNNQNSKQDFSDQLGFSIELIGNFRSLVDFLTKFENMPYFAKVYSFQTVLIDNNTMPHLIGSGNLQSPEQNVSVEMGDRNNIKTTLIIGVYTNGAK